MTGYKAMYPSKKSNNTSDNLLEAVNKNLGWINITAERSGQISTIFQTLKKPKRNDTGILASTACCIENVFRKEKSARAIV